MWRRLEGLWDVAMLTVEVSMILPKAMPMRYYRTSIHVECIKSMLRTELLLLDSLQSLHRHHCKKKVFIALGSIIPLSMPPSISSFPIIVTLCPLSVKYAVAIETFNPEISISRSYAKWAALTTGTATVPFVLTYALTNTSSGALDCASMRTEPGRAKRK